MHSISSFSKCSVTAIYSNSDLYALWCLKESGCHLRLPVYTVALLRQVVCIPVLFKSSLKLFFLKTVTLGLCFQSVTVSSLEIGCKLLQCSFSDSEMCRQQKVAIILDACILPTHFQVSALLSFQTLFSSLHGLKTKQRKRNKEQMLKWSTSTILTGLLHSHLPYILTFTNI